MICLGIESTAHTFGCGIVSKKKVLSNVKASYTTEKGGIIPTDAAKHHEEVAQKVIQEAFRKAKVIKVDLISYSAGPGIGPCLHVGVNAAKVLSKDLNVPLIGINHCIAHLNIAKLVTKVKDPVLLYASGANTQVIAFEGGRYRIFGETLDQGIGNVFDAFARYIGLGFPGGPKIEQLALKSKNYIELPYAVKGMDVSFSGLLTNLKTKYTSKKFKVEDLCFSLQETAFAMLLEVTERAMAHCNKQELVLGGGVACNKRLQAMAKIMCKERGAKFYVPPNDLLVDNGAMIGYEGLLEYSAGHRDKLQNIRPYERTDEVSLD